MTVTEGSGAPWVPPVKFAPILSYTLSFPYNWAYHHVVLSWMRLIGAYASGVKQTPSRLIRDNDDRSAGLCLDRLCTTNANQVSIS